jgi:hypothetical protein
MLLLLLRAAYVLAADPASSEAASLAMPAQIEADAT